MKIKIKTFKEFLVKARMSKGEAIEETLFRFEEDGLKISANSKAQLSRVEAELNTEAFADYEAIGNVGMDKFGVFVNALGRFKDTIEISKSGNIMTLKEDKKSVDVELVAEDYIEADREAPKFEYEEEFTILGTKLADIFKDAQLNTDAVIIVETKENAVVFKNTGKFKFTTEMEAEGCKGGVHSEFGQALIDAISNLKGDLVMNVKNDYPMTVTETEDNSTIKIIVAPRVVDNKVSKKKEAKEEVKTEVKEEAKVEGDIPKESSAPEEPDVSEEQA